MNRDEKATLAREQLRRFASQRALRRRVAKADYGIRLEWDVEWRGTTIASLSDPVSKDDNWISFRFSPLTPDPDLRERMETAPFWMRPDLVFRNFELNLVATYAVAAGEGPSGGRISLQPMHFDFDLSFLDSLHLYWERFRASCRRN